MTTWRTLIDSDATLASFIQSGNDSAIVDILNDKTEDAIRFVSRLQFINWAAKTGIRADIEDAILNLDPTKRMLRAIALSLVDMARGGGEQGVDFSNPGNVYMLGLWLSDGKINQTQHDELLTLATIKISKAEQAMGRDATIFDVATALRNDDGTLKE